MISPIALSEPQLPVDWDLVPLGQSVLVAVSGGADSMALLLTLAQGGRDVVVAHVNHGLRGAESDADEVFVAEHCIQYELPYVTERLDIFRNDHVNEADARDARYAALVRCAQEQGCGLVATGHTATDLLETVLINWLRGAAVAGLQGIRPVRPLAADIVLVRPLLAATRAQTRAACLQASWEWREDASNHDPRYLRNRVRHELLPALESLAGADAPRDRLARQTARACMVLREEQDYLDSIASDHLTALTLRGNESLLALDGIGFRVPPVALQRRVLRAAVQQLQGSLSDLSLEAVEAVRLHVAADGRRKVWQWRRGVNVEWTGAMAGNRIRLWVVSHSG